MADKKLKIALCAGVAAVVILMILLLTTCSGAENPEPTVPEQTQQWTEATETTEAIETEAPTQAPTEEPTEPTEATEPTEPEETQGSSGGSSTPGGYNPNFGKDDDTDDKKEEDTFKAPEAGAMNNPYVEVLSADHLEISTVILPAGKTVHYEIYGAANSVMTLEAANAKVTYGETVYTPNENGVISLTIGNETKPVALQLTNSGAAEASYVLRFRKPGGKNDPIVLESIERIAVELAAGEESGCYYLWRVTDTCELTLKPKSTGYVIHATCGVTTVSNADSADGALVINVTRGAELTLQIVAVPDDAGKYPKISDVVTGTIPEKGSLKNPIELETLTPDALELAGGADCCRYYSWTAEKAGTFSVTVKSAEPENVVCNVTLNPKEESKSLRAASNTGMLKTLASAIEEAPSTTASKEVAAGEKVLIRVEVIPDENGDYPAAKITFTCAFTAKFGTEENPIVLQAPEDTLTVPAGKSVYCKVSTPGMEMILTGENVSVRVGETEYTPEAGKISIACGEEASILLVVTNNGEEEAVYTVTFRTPEETKPEETQPEETQPEETQPEETQPEETQPEETQPEETQPEETQPEVTQPEETQPEETLPESEAIPEQTE